MTAFLAFLSPSSTRTDHSGTTKEDRNRTQTRLSRRIGGSTPVRGERRKREDTLRLQKMCRGRKGSKDRLGRKYEYAPPLCLAVPANRGLVVTGSAALTIFRGTPPEMHRVARKGRDMLHSASVAMADHTEGGHQATTAPQKQRGRCYMPREYEADITVQGEGRGEESAMAAETERHRAPSPHPHPPPPDCTLLLREKEGLPGRGTKERQKETDGRGRGVRVVSAEVGWKDTRPSRPP